MKSIDKIIGWLLEGPPWVQYRARQDILGQPERDVEVIAAKQAMLTHPQIKALLSELADWPGPALKRHNDASHLLHKLVFISDLGLSTSDPGIKEIIGRILEHRSKQGAFQIVANISPRYGGSGQDQLAWMLCDTPSVLYCLVKLGLRDNLIVQSAAKHLASLSFENGWPCTVSPEFGNFRGPGRKTDPCPYGTLISLKVLAQFPEWRDSKVCKTGVETILQLWEQRKERRPYLFAMGTDFVKLKMPLIWYDILHVLEVLTQFPHLQKDKRILEMISVIEAKSDGEGRFTAESIWKSWSAWEFGQKKEPSFLVTFEVYRILKRLSINL
jgi:hypothetical protein